MLCFSPDKLAAGRTYRARGRRPGLERLEGRRLLTTITVDTTSDVFGSGQTTLREALLTAQDVPQPRIVFNIPGPGPYVIRPFSPLPDVTADGVVIDGTTQPGFRGTPIVRIDGTFIKQDIPNTPTDGLNVLSSNNTIRGLALTSFTGAGIALGPGTANVIAGNDLGFDPSTNTATPNALGLRLSQSSKNTIGGVNAGDGNVVSGNTQDGIDLNLSDGNLVRGNIIGLNPAANAPLGNGGNGLRLVNSASNTVVGNTIGANLVGIAAAGVQDRANIIQSNVIGPAPSLGNLQDGIVLGSGPLGTLQGGILPGGNLVGGAIGPGQSGSPPGANVIAFNGGNGVVVDVEVGDSVLGNVIVSNAGQGISLVHQGNNNQPAPQLQAFTMSHRQVDLSRILGTLQAAPNTAYHLEFFETPADPSGFGQGQRSLGADNVTTDAQGKADFGEDFAITLSPGFVITATATAPSGDTSQFSNDLGPEPNSLTVLNTNDSGPNSLRQAMLYANRFADVTVDFAIPGGGVHTIAPLSPLPTITRPVVIDARTQPGYTDHPLVEVDGEKLAGTPADGFLVDGTSLQLMGMAVNRFPLSGVHVRNGGTLTLGLDYLGTDALGTTALGNGRSGLFLENAGAFQIFGGDAPGRHTLFSGNVNGAGIEIAGGGASAAGLGSAIRGSLIGTDATGTRTLGNGTGISVLNRPPLLITGNTISGNTTGLVLGPGTRGNTVTNNLVGTDASGASAVPNTREGILVQDSPANTIGGTTGAGNLVSGNGVSGIRIANAGSSGNFVVGNRIGTDATGTRAVGNGSAGVYIDNAPGNDVGSGGGSGNLISGNASSNVQISGPGASGNVVFNNLIGTDAAGARALGNAQVGVFVDGAPATTIGGTAAETPNVISGSVVGVELAGATARGGIVAGNRIGTNAAGTAAVPNSVGILLDGAPGNTVGGLAPGAGNLISGNSSVGLRIAGAGASGNLAVGNLIGTDVSGAGRLGNGFDGVFLDAPANTIGGTTPAARNVISGNRSVGLQLYSALAQGNLIQGNYIGTDAAGLGSLGNGIDGIYINNAPANTIGGTTPGAGNLIAASGSSAIQIFGPGASGNVIQGNAIGTNAAGAPTLGNEVAVFINGRGKNVIGGTARGAANVSRGNRFGIVYGTGATPGPGGPRVPRRRVKPSGHPARKP